MGFDQFINQAISGWMTGNGPESDIVISSRVRLARNLKNYPFPTLATDSQAAAVVNEIKQALDQEETRKIKNFELIPLEELTELQKEY